MTNKQKINAILEYFDELYPDAHCELNYKKDYELVIAVMLSAQTTDDAVNKITPKLFCKYSNLLELSKANFSDVENIIRPLGLSKVKAKNIIEISRILITDFDSKVPSDKLTLQKLPGIGNKSAGVIRAEIFEIPDLPVDTHVSRVSKRLRLADETNSPIEIEVKLKKIIDKERWIKSHHQFIYFGRYFCLAKNPNCCNCKIRDFCKEKLIPKK